MRHSQCRPNLLQETNCEINALLFGSIQSFPPPPKFIGELDFPRHLSTMSWTTLCCQGHIKWGPGTQKERLYARASGWFSSSATCNPSANTGPAYRVW